MPPHSVLNSPEKSRVSHFRLPEIMRLMPFFVVVTIASYASGDVCIYYNNPQAIDWNDGDPLVVRPGTIECLDVTTGQQATVVSGLASSSGLAFDPAGNLYYGSCTDGSFAVNLIKRDSLGAITTIAEAANTAGGDWPIGGWGFSTAVNQDKVFYNSPQVVNWPPTSVVRDGTLKSLNPTTGQQATVVSGLVNASGLAFDNGGNLYYGSCTGDQWYASRDNLYRRAVIHRSQLT